MGALFLRQVVGLARLLSFGAAKNEGTLNFDLPGDRTTVPNVFVAPFDAVSVPHLYALSSPTPISLPSLTLIRH